jgi:hypothetical protein
MVPRGILFLSEGGAKFGYLQRENPFSMVMAPMALDLDRIEYIGFGFKRHT